MSDCRQPTERVPMNTPVEQREQELNDFLDRLKTELEDHVSKGHTWSVEDRLNFFRVCFTELATQQGLLLENKSLSGAIARIALLKEINSRVGSFAKNAEEKEFLLNQLARCFVGEILILLEPTHLEV